MPETEVYDEGDGLLLDSSRPGVLGGRSGLADRTERRRIVFAIEVVGGTLVGSGRAGRAGWRGAVVGSRRYLARLQGEN